MAIPSVNEIKMTKQDIWNAIAVVYPVCKQGLEIECDVGYNLSVGRKRAQNLWGISSKDHTKEWVTNGVNVYCKQMKTTDMNYTKDTFDVVINNNDMNLKDKFEARKTLRNIKRICSSKAYLNLPLEKGFTKSWWLKTIISMKFIVECFHVTTANTLVVELQC